METGCADRILTIRKIGYGQILDARDLLDEYSAECSIPEIGAPNPQRELYANMEAMGLMDSFGAFDGDELVGFATVLVFTLPHYGKKIANVESLFLRKSQRHSGCGQELMGAVQSHARSTQCCGVLYNARAGSRLERLLNALKNYDRTNSVFFWSSN
jgi:GNAT superfamily N-acetyltransferase